MNRLEDLVKKGNDSVIIEFLIGKGVLKIPGNCDNKANCKNNPLVLRQRNNEGDQYWWRCTKCLRSTTVRKNSFLSKFNIRLNKGIQLICQWALQHVQNDII